MNEDRTNTERDRRVLALYEQVIEVEQRLIPTGLHVFGRRENETQIADLLRMIASFDRPEYESARAPQFDRGWAWAIRLSNAAQGKRR